MANNSFFNGSTIQDKSYDIKQLTDKLDAAIAATAASQQAAAVSASSADLSNTQAAGNAATAAQRVADATTQAQAAAQSASNSYSYSQASLGYRDTASQKASDASTSAANALSYANQAGTSYNSTLGLYNAFNSKYLGTRSSDPLTDALGAAVAAGATYFNTTIGAMKVFDGASWQTSFANLSNYAPLSGAAFTGDISAIKASGNGIKLATAAAGAAPTISVQGADANQTLVLQGKGGNGIDLWGGQGLGLNVNASASAVNYSQFTGTGAGTGPLLSVNGSDTNIDLRFRTKGTGSYQFDTGTNANTQFKITNTASAVNYVNTTGATTGNSPALSAQGSDTNINIALASKGTGSVFHVTGGNTQFAVSNTASAVNYVQATGAAAANSVSVRAAGSDTNVPLALLGKGAYGIAVGTTTTQPNAYLHVNSPQPLRTTLPTVASYDTVNSIVTTTVAHGLSTGDCVTYRSTGTGATGLNSQFQYFVNVLSTTTFTVHDTLSQAIAGTGKRAITAAGTGTETFLSSSMPFSTQVSSGNGSYIENVFYRHTAGTDWSGASQRIQAKTDITPQGFVEFNPKGNGYGTVVGAQGSGYISFVTGSDKEQVRVLYNGSSVNYLALSGNASGNAPNISAGGTDANININLISKGTGVIQANGNAVWHAGNLTPSNYAPLASPTFTGTVTLPAGSNVPNPVGSTNGAVAAAGTTQATATALTADVNVVTTGTGGVQVTGSPQGKYAVIVNRTASAINVYPATGHSFDTLAANAPISLPANGFVEMFGYSSTGWSTTYQAVTTGSYVQGNIPGNAANVTGTVAIANGGTGATTASAALTNLGALPLAGGSLTGNLGVGSATPNYAGWGRTVTLESATNVATEFASTRADATGAIIGAVDANFRTNSVNHNRIGSLILRTSGNTVNQRGGGFAIQLKPDAQTALVEYLAMDDLGNVTLSGTGGVKLPAGTTAQRPSGIAGHLRYNSTNNQFEGYNGSAWGSLGGASGASGNAAFYENDTNITADYSITSGKNAMSAGPITINNAVTVTVPSGSTWTVV